MTSAETASQEARFAAFAALCEHLTATSSRLERAQRIAEYLGALSADDAESASQLLVGRAFPEAHGRKLSLGGRAVPDAVEAIGGTAQPGAWAGVVDFGGLVAQMMPPLPSGPPLSLHDVRDGFAAIAQASGSGSRRQRIEQLAALLRRTTPLEAKYLVKIVIGEMRHGVQEGIVLDAIARLSGAAATAVRRANQALGDLGRLVHVAKTDPGALAGIAVQLFRPIKPMLAQSAPDIRAAFAALAGSLALEWKLDGARVQIHKRGDEVRIFSRRLQDITRSLPDIAASIVAAGGAPAAIFEGEVIAVAHGRPLPFQELMRRFRRVHDVVDLVAEIPVELQLFDLLYLDGTSWLERTAAERWAGLQTACGTLICVARALPHDADAAERFYASALAAGHEGVIAKALAAPYAPGRRGRGWLKVKPHVTLDLVIVAADWGYGRRHGWLSNYHLAVSDPSTGAFLEVGKTFKGPTDAEFRTMTERLLQLRERQEGGMVYVRPETVVEVRFDGIQKSSQYPCGMALRFARIVRRRDDKSPDEADTVETLQALFAQQHGEVRRDA